MSVSSAMLYRERDTQRENILSRMDSLLCDEDWLRSPHQYPSPSSTTDHKNQQGFYTTTEECQEALMVFLQKEECYMPQAGYPDRLQLSNLLLARINAVHFFIKSCSRLNLSLETVFGALNCFDRFVSMNQYCHTRIESMADLISIACLSVSTKFVEVSIPYLHELQMDAHPNHSYQPSTIQKMELEMLTVLQWRVNCVTSYSYKELLLKLLDCDLQPQLRFALSSRFDELLLDSLSDPKFTEFRPSTIALSALKCSLEELLPSKSDVYLLNLVSLVPQDQKIYINDCHKMMEERVADPVQCLYFPSSPVTVLPIQRIDAFNCYIDLSIVSGSKVTLQQNPKKLKREGDSFKKQLFNLS